MNETGYGTHQGIAATGWARVFFYFIQFTWGLTVNLAGLLVFLCCNKRFPREMFCNSIITQLPGNRGGLSLGIFIFLSIPSDQNSASICAHEYGHTIQCLFLGPLFWFIVAIPSAIWYRFFEDYRQNCHVQYDTLYCERWATAWGRKWSRT